MSSDVSAGRAAVVTFARPEEAARRVAGVAAAARIVRELDAAGFARVLLVVPGGRLDRSACDDLARICGRAEFRIVAERGDAMAAVDAELLLPGNLLVPAAALATLAPGDGAWPPPGTIALDRPEAAAQILRRTGKTSDGPVSRALNRPVSRRLSALLLRLPGTRPIHATLGTALLAAAMFAALVWGGRDGLLIGGLLFQAASVFDGVDGEIARATFRASRSGAVIDSVVDVATNLLFLAGLTLNLVAAGSERALPLTVWGFGLFVLGLAAIAWRASRAPGSFSLDMVKHHYRRRFPGRLVPWLIEWMTIVSSRDFFALLFAVLLVAGLPLAVLYIFAAAATVWIAFVSVALLTTRGGGAAASDLLRKA